MLFLASPLSDFMTGQTVNVDGGISFLYMSPRLEHLERLERSFL
jgi:enoyl-[acyl-carrier-protein] reductase (NADH)